LWAEDTSAPSVPPHNNKKSLGHMGCAAQHLILLPFMNDAVFGILYGLVAGIMVFISFDELLPGAEVYGEHHLAIYGLVGGMAIMALSLWMFI
jgi:ZIP family zinc transporter